MDRTALSSTEHRAMLALRDRLRAALVAEQAKRSPDNLDWIDNELAVLSRESGVPVDQIAAIEHLALGHSDYTAKICLYVAELAHGTRRIR